MKNHRPIPFLFALLCLWPALVRAEPAAAAPAPAAPPAPAAASPAPAPALPTALSLEDGNFSGKALEVIDASSYTYILVETSAGQLWAAATQFPVKAGDTVVVYGGVPMPHFHSRTLNRDFDTVYFTGKIVDQTTGADSSSAGQPSMPEAPAATGPAGALPPNHPATTAAAPKIDLVGIKKAEGGKTVQEIVADAPLLAGQPVLVRARVVKYKDNVLGKNWLHLRDGTGDPVAKDNDLTVTTSATVKVGDLVLVRGKVTVNKDFGAGYKYPVIVEDAAVTVE